MSQNPRLDIGQLADLLDGRLPPEARRRVERALADDPDAQATERWLRGFLETAAAIPLEPRSALVEQRLQQHFTRWMHAQEVLSAPSERVRAELVYDSRRDGALAGVRGGATDTDESISLVWECDQGELSVEVLPDDRGRDDRVRLLGQILLNADSDAPIFEATAVTGGTRRSAESDEFGRFRIDELHRADTELRVGNGLLEIGASIDLGGPLPPSARSHPARRARPSRPADHAGPTTDPPDAAGP